MNRKPVFYGRKAQRAMFISRYGTLLIVLFSVCAAVA